MNGCLTNVVLMYNKYIVNEWASEIIQAYNHVFLIIPPDFNMEKTGTPNCSWLCIS